MMRIVQQFLFVLASMLPVLGRAENPLTLETYLIEVKDSNPSLRASKLQAAAQEHRITPSSTWDDPFFAVGPDQIAFDGSGGSMLRFQVSQSLPFPGKLTARGDAAEYKFHALKAGAETTEREILVLATQAFYRAYYNERALKLNRELKSLLEGAIASTKARYQTGDSSHHDWILARVELSILEVEKMRLEREGQTLIALLNEFRSKPPDTLFSIEVIDFEVSEEKEPTFDPSQQPELKSLASSVGVAEADGRYARLSLLPDFVIQGMAMKPMHNMGMASEKSNWGVMVGVNIPLFFWGKQLELTRAAESTKNAAIAEKTVLENRIRTELTDAKVQFKTARDVVALYKKDVVPLTEIAVQNARTGYAAKRVPLPQFIEALRVKRTQELELLAAQIDVKLSQMRLREVLSAPPVLRLAPTRPTLFGGSTMGGMGSDTVNMGRGMSGPSRKSGKESGGLAPSGGGAMPGMGGGM